MDGIESIAAERARQIEELGYTPEHDAGHEGQDLAFAAAVYAAPTTIYLIREIDHDNEHHQGGTLQWVEPWPVGWHRHSSYRKVLTPEERIHQLAKAGALIAAEIDRLQAGGEMR